MSWIRTERVPSSQESEEARRAYIKDIHARARRLLGLNESGMQSRGYERLREQASARVLPQIIEVQTPLERRRERRGWSLAQ